jgi:hypothetical protein
MAGNVSQSGGLQLEDTASRLSIPVAVVLERKVNPDSRWGYPTWRAHAVIAGEGIARPGGDSVIDLDNETRRTIHTGFTLDLYKDGSEGYWYNLLSDEPCLFVICEGDYSATEIQPMHVTANQDEANGHLESEDIVLPVPMPAEITALLERYVISHYRPEARRKRKRRDWLEDSEYAGERDRRDRGNGRGSSH